MIDWRIVKQMVLAALVVSTLAGCEKAGEAPPGAAPYYRPPTPAELACVNQGFLRGTDAYERCLARESGTPAPPPPAVVTPPAGVEVFRDEYGHRYDGQGNRLDSSGRIINPQST